MAQPSSPTSDQSRLSAFFKKIYGQADLENAAVINSPLLKGTRKKDNLEGDGIWHPWNYLTPTGGSADFSKAQANATGSKGQRIFCEVNEFHQFIYLESLGMRASRSKMGAYLEMKRKEMDEAIDDVGMQMARALWGDGSGAIAQIATGGVSTDTVTLANSEDTINFREGMIIAANPNKTGNAGTLRTTNEVKSVDDDNGKVVFTSDVSADSWAAGDHLYVDGNYDSMMVGIDGYIPSSPISSTETFKTGADRSKRSWLAGHRQSYLGTIEETVKRLVVKMARHRLNTKQTVVWLSYYNWHVLEMELGSRAIRDADDSSKRFGTQTLKMSTPKGLVTVAADPFLDDDKGYVLDMSTWILHHLDPFPHFVKDDGLIVVRAQNFSGLEARVRAWMDLACLAPWRNGRFAVS